MPRAQSSFEDIAGVSDDANQILRNIFVGLGLCKNGLTLPRITLNDHVYTSLFDLETRLMTWAQTQQSARNNGFEVWHAKYLAGCCFLVGCEISVYRKTSSVQTTTRTTRCAVSMVNEVVRDVHSAWGSAAYSLLPALAMRKYMLASVARHCEQKRSITIPEVSRNVEQRFRNPGEPDYPFNPVALFSKLTGEEDTRIASWLGLPYIPGMAECSWQDLGLVSVQNYADTIAAESAYNFDENVAPSRTHGLPSPPPLDDVFLRAMPISTTSQSFASTSYSLAPSLGQMQTFGTIPSEALPSQVQFPSQMISRPRTESPWPTPPQRNAQCVKEESRCDRCGEPSPKRQRLGLRHHQSQPQMGDAQLASSGHRESPFGRESTATHAKRRQPSFGSQQTIGDSSNFTNNYVGNGYGAIELDRPFNVYSQIEEIENPEHSGHF